MLAECPAVTVSAFTPDVNVKSGAAVTVKLIAAPEALLASLASPLYTAVKLWPPTLGLVKFRIATLEVSVTGDWATPSSVKVTVPDGTVLPDCGATTAFSITLVPNTDVAGVTLSVSVVDVCTRTVTAVEVDAR
jgi:hypothetical protein